MLQIRLTVQKVTEQFVLNDQALLHEPCSLCNPACLEHVRRWANEFIDWYLMSCSATNRCATSGISNNAHVQGFALKKWKSGDECLQQSSSVEVPIISAPLICSLLIMAQITVNQRMKKIGNKTPVKLATKSSFYSMHECICPPKIRYGESDWFINCNPPYHFGTFARNRQTQTEFWGN